MSSFITLCKFCGHRVSQHDCGKHDWKHSFQGAKYTMCPECMKAGKVPCTTPAPGERRRV